MDTADLPSQEIKLVQVQLSGSAAVISVSVELVRLTVSVIFFLIVLEPRLIFFDRWKEQLLLGLLSYRIVNRGQS
jgi:hypothetical protein